MKRVLVDSVNDVVYVGEDAKEVMNVLLKPFTEVTEEDELKYEDQLRGISWKGELKYEVHFDLKFRGIDDWNRPVFKDVDSSIYFGCTEKLFDWNADEKEVIEYFKENPHLEYFGSSFNCEPNGGVQDFFKFSFVEA